MKISADTTIEELLEQHPELNREFVRLGLPCFVCGEPVWGTVADVCHRHHRDPAEVLAVLNAAREAGSRGEP